MQGQFRLSGMGRVMGLDYPAAFALGQARGIDPWLLAEFLPDLEKAAVTAINETLKESDG